jgi:hypothetical protein
VDNETNSYQNTPKEHANRVLDAVFALDDNIEVNDSGVEDLAGNIEKNDEVTNYFQFASLADRNTNPLDWWKELLNLGFLV